MLQMQISNHYRAEGLAPLAEITDDGALLSTLARVMLGWRMVPVKLGDAETAAAVRIVRTRQGWTCSGVTFDRPVTFSDPVATACGLIAALYKAQTLEDRGSVILHAAGVRIGEGLILLTGHYRSGKTIFTTACAAAGLQVFSDDIVPLDSPEPVACAVGLAIRLRLPLPENLLPATRAFIEAHRIAASDRYIYIRPQQDRLARRGERAPIRGIVALRRTGDGPARLHRLAPADALSEAIRRNFARETLAGAILNTLDTLTARVSCLTLTYSRAEEAVALLHDTFREAEPKIMDQPPPRAHEAKGHARSPLPNHTRLSRAPGVGARERGGQAFITDAEEQVIYNLNPTGSAVWRALEQPITFGELTDLFAAAFPDRDPAELAADLSHLVRKLAQGGLVLMKG